MTVKDTIIKALFANTVVGDEGFTKHDILIWSQEIDSSIKDGANVGFSITALVNDRLVEVMNPEHKPIKYRRIK